jgi:ribosomal protein S18 acetylase RimI-like enzyme
MSIEVEQITESHVDGFRACLDAVARERKFLARMEAPPRERVEEFVRESVKNNAAQYVAVDGPLVVGWCDIFPDQVEALKHRGSLGMGVLAHYRGRGIGKELIVATLAHARRDGISRVELEVRVDNAAAISLYEHLGFIREGCKRNGMRFDGSCFDSLTMGLVYPD